MTSRFLIVLMLVLAILIPASDVLAANDPNIAKPMGTCTTDPSFDLLPSTVISDIAQGIQSAISDLAKETFENINVGMPVAALGTLYVFIYGTLFMFGAVPVTIWEAVVRLSKLAFVMALVGAGSSGDIYRIMHGLFENGTNDLLNGVISLMSGTAGTGAPLGSVDALAAKVVSAKMIVTLMAAFTTPPYGIILGILIFLSIKSLISAVLSAAWIYLMSMVVRALLYGVAPIFIPCLLFARTRHMFDGWLNQLVNASLQPIFLFAFFSFFVALTSNMVDEVLKVPVCWSPMSDTARGTPLLFFGWRFTIPGETGYELYSGEWGLDGVNGNIFPIPISTILLFFVLAELASRFNHIVLAVAGGIAGASTTFADMRGMFTNWGSQGGIGRREKEAAESRVAVDHGQETPERIARRQAEVGVGRRR